MPKPLRAAFILAAPILASCLALDAQTPHAFPDVQGWNRTTKIQQFAPETLFEYIDGAADGFLAYAFQGLQVAEYTRASKGSVVIEIYRHASPLHAFGIYSQEKSDSGPFEAIGAQGYVAPPILVFYKGDHYVKINAYDLGAETEATLRAFAKAQEACLNGPAALPAELAFFPKEGKQPNSERFVLDNVLGYAFLHNGFTAEYSAAGSKFQMLLIKGKDALEARTMLAALLAQAQQPSAEWKEGRFAFKDANYGEIALAWKGSYLALALNISDATKRSEALTRMEALLPPR